MLQSYYKPLTMVVKAVLGQNVYDNVDENENSVWGKQGSLMQRIIYNGVLSFNVNRCLSLDFSPFGF